MAGNARVPVVGHLVQAVHAGGGLLGHPADALGHQRPAVLAGLQGPAEQAEHDLPLVGVVLGRGWDGPGALVLGALVHQHRGVAAVIEDHVRPVLARPGQGLVRAPPVLVQRLALPGEHRDALGVVRGALGPNRDRRGGVVLGGEDVAAGPPDLRAEGGEGLDQDRGLDGHVQRPGDPRTAQRLRVGVLFPDRHQPRHFVLGEPDLLAPEVGKRQIGHLERDGFGRHEAPQQDHGLVRLPRPYGTGRPGRSPRAAFLTKEC